MSNGENVPAIDSDEWLARFIHYRRHIRQDRTVRPDAFIPHPYPDLSVTRYLQLLEAELWQVGREIARQTGRPMYGRANVRALIFLQRELQVLADPIIPENPNHAKVIGWPVDKPSQKIIAQQIAAAAGKALEPPPSQT